MSDTAIIERIKRELKGIAPEDLSKAERNILKIIDTAESECVCSERSKFVNKNCSAKTHRPFTSVQ